MNAEDLNEIFSRALWRNLNIEVCVIQAFGRLNQEASHKSKAMLGGGKIWLSTWLNQESPGERLSKRFPALSWLMCISVGAVLTALMDVGKPDIWYRPRQRTCFAGNVFAHLAFTVWQVHLPRGCCWGFLHWYQNQILQILNRDWRPASFQKYTMPLMPD